MSEAERRIVGTINTEADIPNHFDSEEEEVAFWETHEFSPEYIRAHRIPRDQSPIARIKAKREADTTLADTKLRPVRPD